MDGAQNKYLQVVDTIFSILWNFSRLHLQMVLCAAIGKRTASGDFESVRVESVRTHND